MHFFNNKPSHLHDLQSVLKACLEHDPQAQKALIGMFYGYVKNICIRYVSNNQDVDEIVNDSFLKVFNNLAKYDNLKPFKAWLRTIAVHTAIDFYRKEVRNIQSDNYEKHEIADIDTDAISKISADEILKFVQQLSPAYRMVFVLYVIDGYAHREIAEMLNIKEGTSKSNLQDARIKLQAMILKANPDLYFAYEIKKRMNNEN